MTRERRLDDISRDRDSVENARSALENAAARVLGEPQRAALRGLSDRGIRELVLSKLSPSFDCRNRSDDAISAAFTYAVGRPLTPAQQADPAALVARQWEAMVQDHFDALEREATRKTAEAPIVSIPGGSSPADVAALFAKAEMARQNAWRGPVLSPTSDVQKPPHR